MYYVKIKRLNALKKAILHIFNIKTPPKKLGSEKK